MSVEARTRSWVLARAVRRVVARLQRRAGVRGAIGGVEVGDEEVELDLEDEGLTVELTVECWRVAKRGREILGRPSRQTGRRMWTSLSSE